MICTQGRCLRDCTGAGWTTACGGCVQLAVNARHCGRCDNSCGVRPNATVPCVDGACAAQCRPGFYDCNGDPGDGCEEDLSALPLSEQRCPGDGGARDAGVDGG